MWVSFNWPISPKPQVTLDRKSKLSAISVTELTYIIKALKICRVTQEAEI